MTAQVFRQCVIVSLDTPSLKVEGFYNPNKIKISKSVTWKSHSNPQGNASMLEFDSGKKNGRPVRATCSLKLTEIDVVQLTSSANATVESSVNSEGVNATTRYQILREGELKRL